MTTFNKHDPKKRVEEQSKSLNEVSSLFELCKNKAFQEADDSKLKSQKIIAEKIHDYANGNPHMIGKNQLHLLKQIELERLVEHIKKESTTIATFKLTERGKGFKREWMDIVRWFLDNISQNFNQINLEIGGINTKAIQFINTELRTISTDPTIKNFLEKLNECDLFVAANSNSCFAPA